MTDYIELKTTENTKVLIRRQHIAGVEEIPPTVRSAGYIKLYVAGFAFQIQVEEKDRLLKELMVEI